MKNLKRFPPLIDEVEEETKKKKKERKNQRKTRGVTNEWTKCENVFFTFFIIKK